MIQYAVNYRYNHDGPRALTLSSNLKNIFEVTSSSLHSHHMGPSFD
jgi:hypothetical protein